MAHEDNILIKLRRKYKKDEMFQLAIRRFIEIKDENEELRKQISYFHNNSPYLELQNKFNTIRTDNIIKGKRIAILESEISRKDSLIEGLQLQIEK